VKRLAIASLVAFGRFTAVSARYDRKSGFDAPDGADRGSSGTCIRWIPGGTMARPYRSIAPLLVLAALGCGAPADDAAPVRGGQPSISSGEPRVPRAPTTADQLPPAIVGQGGELEGRD
jgi:hypothetical protein